MVENTNASQTPLSSRIILDSSIVLAWLLEDERTNQLVRLFTSIYEVANALRSAIIRKRLTLDQSDSLTSDFEQLHCQLIPNQHLDTLLTLAKTLDISAYALLAKNLNAPLYTLDVKLHKKIGTFIQCKVIQ